MIVFLFCFVFFYPKLVVREKKKKVENIQMSQLTNKRDKCLNEGQCCDGIHLWHCFSDSVAVFKYTSYKLVSQEQRNDSDCFSLLPKQNRLESQATVISVRCQSLSRLDATCQQMVHLL